MLRNRRTSKSRKAADTAPPANEVESSDVPSVEPDESEADDAELIGGSDGEEDDELGTGADDGGDSGEDDAPEDDVPEDDADPDDAGESDADAGDEWAIAVVTHTVDDAGGLVYDLSSWRREHRRQLDLIIVDLGVERVWQGSEVVVRSMDGPDVDETIAALVLEHSGTALGGARVIYEVSHWPVGFRASLVESMTVAGIDFAWDANGDLEVAFDDEDRTDELLAAMPNPDEESDEADGIEVQQLLSELYAAVDVLYKNPDSSVHRLSLAEVTDRLEWVRLPFGFDAAEWDRLVSGAAELRAFVDSGEDLTYEDTDEAADSDDEVADDKTLDADDASEDAAAAADADAEPEAKRLTEREFANRARRLRNQLLRLV